MEGLIQFFSTLWEQLATITIPIIEINICQFLLGVFAINIAIIVLKIIFSMHSSHTSNDKSEGD